MMNNFTKAVLVAVAIAVAAILGKRIGDQMLMLVTAEMRPMTASDVQIFVVSLCIVIPLLFLTTRRSKANQIGEQSFANKASDNEAK